MERKQIVGVIYPVLHSLVGRLLDEGKTVFVKYLPRPSSRLKVGDKILFYASRGIHGVVGEGIIKRIEYLKPEEIQTKKRRI